MTLPYERERDVMLTTTTTTQRPKARRLREPVTNQRGWRLLTGATAGIPLSACILEGPFLGPLAVPTRPLDLAPHLGSLQRVLLASEWPHFVTIARPLLNSLLVFRVSA